ncbi:MAG: hypothetical protein Q9181_006851 [Wetmoreana brouardii]
MAFLILESLGLCYTSAESLNFEADIDTNGFAPSLTDLRADELGNLARGGSGAVLVAGGLAPRLG